MRRNRTEEGEKERKRRRTEGREEYSIRYNSNIIV